MEHAGHANCAGDGGGAVPTAHLYAEASTDGFGIQAGDGKVPLRRDKLAPIGREDHEGFGGTGRIGATAQGIQACVHHLVAAGVQLVWGAWEGTGHEFDGSARAGAGAQFQAGMPLFAELQTSRSSQRIGEATGQVQPVPARRHVQSGIGPAPRQHKEEGEEQAPEGGAAAQQHYAGESWRTGGEHDVSG